MHNQYKQVSLSLKELSVGKFLMFFVWPFSAVIYSFTNFRKRSAPALFWLFCIYFGFVFIYSDPVWGGADSGRYAANLTLMHHNPLSFQNLWHQMYNPLLGSVDIFEPLVTWVVAIFTGDPRFFFLVIAAIFGFFYTQNLWMLYSRITSRPGLFLFLIMLAYGLAIPIWNINGVRMYTAAHIFIFGVLRHFLYDDKRGFIWSSLAVLVHFSFFFPLVILVAWTFLPLGYSSLFTFYVLTFFLKELDLGQLRSSLSFAPEVFQTRIRGYTNEEYARGAGASGQALAWHVKAAGFAGKVVIISWISAIYLNRQKFENLLPHFKRFFLFALFFGGLANIASSVPSGGRFVAIANMMFLAIIILVLSKPFINNRFSMFKKLVLIFVAFSVIFQLRTGLDYMGFLTFFGNPVLAYFIEVQTPIITFIKDILS